MSEHVELTLDLDPHFADGHGWQLSISVVDERGGGHGFRIFGPTYAGCSENLRRVRVTADMAKEIRAYLDRVSEEP